LVPFFNTIGFFANFFATAATLTVFALAIIFLIGTDTDLLELPELDLDFVNTDDDLDKDGFDTDTVGLDTNGLETDTDGLDADGLETDTVGLDTNGLDADTYGLDADTDGLDADTDGLDADTDGLDADTDGLDADTYGLDADTDGLDAEFNDNKLLLLPIILIKVVFNLLITLTLLANDLFVLFILLIL
jgi:hypothetical protein